MGIREWVEHYKWQGIDRILLLDNNSTDDWKSKIEDYMSFVDVIRAEKNQAQTEHYNTIGLPWLKSNKIDIVGIVDLDEYVFGTDGRTVKEHLSELFKDDSLSKVKLTWHEFGSSGHVQQPKSIRSSFTWKKKFDPSVNVKCFSRVRDVISLEIHDHKVKGREIFNPPGLQLNHYRIQSKEFFEKVKMNRGDGQHPEAVNMRNWKYFEKYDFKNAQNTQLKQQVNAQKGGTRRKRKQKRSSRHRLSFRKTVRQRGGQSFVPTFHVFIPSGGRPSLKALLDSLKPQLKEGDAVTVVFDGEDAPKKASYTEDWLNGFVCSKKVIIHSPRINKWSHGIQNEYQNKISPETTFLMYADDDDTYMPDAFQNLRSKCVNPECLYIAKMTYASDRNKIIPRDTSIAFGNIGTPNGIIPFKDAFKSKWGMRYGGDFDYYNDLQSKVKCVEHIDSIIYLVGVDQGDVQ